MQVAEEEEDTASEGEAADDARVAPDAGEPADRHGDTTESSDGDVDADGGSDGDGNDNHAVASSVPAAGSDSDSAAYKDSELDTSLTYLEFLSDPF